MATAHRRQPLRPNGPPPLDADDILYSGSDDDYYDSPAERQRRHEIQSARYLQGKPLTLFSAQLRGPFSRESGWHNPWLGKSKADNEVKDTTAPPTPHGLSTRPSNSAALYVPGRDSVTVTPLKLDPLTQPSSCHLPSPISSSSYGATMNPYMDCATWGRVQAWRNDVAAKAEQAEELQLTATPIAKSPPQKTSRSKRPASSELLRSALAKKSRSSGLDLSIGEPLSTAGQNRSPRTGRRRLSKADLSTPDNRALRNSHASLDSRAALDGSVTGQTTISKGAEVRVSSAGKPAQERGSPMSLAIANEAGNVVDVPTTPTRQYRPLPVGPPSAVVSKASGSGRSPLRPNDTQVNTLTQDSKRSLPSRENVDQGASVNMTEAQEQSPMGYCTQADRSFLYRSKAPKASKKRLLVEATDNARNALHSSFSTETASENPDSPPEDLRANQPKRIYSTGTLGNPDKSTLPDGEEISRGTVNDTSIITEDVADTTLAGIDGPTLIASSSTPLQQAFPQPSDSGPEQGTEPEDIRRNAVGDGDHALPEFKSTQKRNMPPNDPVEVSSPGPPINLQVTKLVVQTDDPYGVQVSEGNPTVAQDTAVRPLSQPHLGSGVDGDCEVSKQDKTASPDEEVPIKSATEREPDIVLPISQQQSPWAKEVIDITPTRLQPSSPVQETLIHAAVGSGPMGSRESNLTTAPVQQSPWTKEITWQTGIDIATEMPSAPLADSANQLSRAAEPTGTTAITASQNPWVSNEQPVEANHEDPRPPPSLSPGRLRHTDGATYSSPVSSNHSPVRLIVDTVAAAPTRHTLPSTPTQQSSLPTPDLTSSIKSFRDFMSPSPEPRRRSKLALAPKASRIEKPHLRKSALSKSRKDRAKRAHLRVSFALPGDDGSGSSGTNTDPDETLDGAELPCREAESPSLVQKASSQASSRRASSPPLELSQSELPAEVTRFKQFFHAQARKGPQVKRPESYKPLLPSASQQRCGSPEADAMAEAFIEADRACDGQDVSGDNRGAPEEEKEVVVVEAAEQSPEEDEEVQEIDDVTAVLDNLGDFLNSFDVEAELGKARREEQQQPERLPGLGLGFPSTQDQMEIMGAGVWD